MRYFLFILFTFVFYGVFAQSIPTNRVVSNKKLIGLLKKEVKGKISSENTTSEISSENTTSEHKLVEYFCEKFSERFFYDYQTFYDRLPHYNNLYKNRQKTPKKGPRPFKKIS